MGRTIPVVALVLVSLGASPALAQVAPDFTAVAPALCALYGLDATCTADDFASPIAIDVDADGRSEWIYVNARGPREVCFVRHVCFSIVAESASGWTAILSSAASRIGFHRQARARHRDLVTGGANTAQEYQLDRFVWSTRRRAYVHRESATCVNGEEASGPALCSAVADEIPLQ